LDEALRMVSLYPAKAIHADHLIGKLEPGCKANWVCLSDDLQIIDIL
jgi:N-acetylglucosamine-6-phosphate deacetylase